MITGNFLDDTFKSLDKNNFYLDEENRRLRIKKPFHYLQNGFGMNVKLKVTQLTMYIQKYCLICLS